MTPLPRTTISSIDWFQAAACRGMDPSVFHPSRGQHRELNVALHICNDTPCPVRAECLTYAHDESLHHGVYGGQTETQRRWARRDAHRALRQARQV